jgi:multidrug resistance efflux pump
VTPAQRLGYRFKVRPCTSKRQWNNNGNMKSREHGEITKPVRCAGRDSSEGTSVAARLLAGYKLGTRGYIMVGPTVENTAQQARNPPQAAAPARQTQHVADRLESLRFDDAERRKIDQRGGSGGILFRLITVVLLLVAVLFTVGMYKNGQFGETEIPAVRLAMDDREGVILTLSGVIVPATSVDVTSVIPGRIVELPIEEGKRVKKGDVLARIEGTGYRADHAEALAALALAESHLKELRNGARPEEIEQVRARRDEAQSRFDHASKELTRAEPLHAKKAITDSAYDAKVAARSEARAMLDQLSEQYALIKKGTREEVIAGAEAEVERAKARCDKTKYFVEQTEVVAPIDGTVLEKKATLGEVTRSEYLPTTLCILGDLSRMQAEVDVQEREIGKLNVGQTCVIYPDALSNKKYAASVTRFQPQVNRQRGVVKVTITLDNPDELLLSEMNCRVEFRDKAAVATEPRLRVPKAAVVQDGKESVAFVLEDGAVTRRVVTLGEENAAGMVEVKSGLAVEEIVLIPGDTKLKAGQRVRPKFE